MRTARLLFGFSVLSLAVGCKQPEGGRCQIAEDCEAPLVCSAAEPRVCRPSGSETIIDAAPAPDSRFDARLGDANVAPPDASGGGSPDAPVTTPDASVTDSDAQ